MIFNVTPMVSPNKIDCAPTCLAMLLNYYGETVTVRDLYEECNLTISGCTGADIARAGRAHGLDMKGYRLDAADVYKSDRPGIIHWQHRHFCVYCGVDTDGRVLIVNPDRGKFHVTKTMFEAMFTGVALFNGEPEDIPEEAPEMTPEETAEYILDILRGVR